MRARYPDCEGIVVRDGIGIRYERYGQGWPAILLLPTWSLVHSRHWKMQVAYLARHFTVVCFDGRGSGGSDRPADASACCMGGALVSLAGAGHFPHVRDPVRVNLLIKQFADRVQR
jgi:pimeloyl-ACP methyl ester carboxylesterase